VSASVAVPTNVIAPRRSVFGRLGEVWEYRELLANLVRKELKVKYKNSTLGFVWSLLNPLVQMVVYTIVFQIVLRAQIPYFPIFLLSAILSWNLFSSSLAGATGSITGNHTLVNKVYFPREILPLANVGANLVHYLLQSLVLLAAIAISPVQFDWRWVWLVIPALAVLLLLAAAIGIFLAAVNVYARDTQHLQEVVLMAWIWVTPMIYPWRLAADKLQDHGLPSSLLLLNPMTNITTALQRALYGQRYVEGLVQGHPGPAAILPEPGQWWYLRNVGLVGLLALVLFVLALRLFGRLEGNFAEEL
jgi:ABC-2 type transport system permease protein